MFILSVNITAEETSTDYYQQIIYQCISLFQTKMSSFHKQKLNYTTEKTNKQKRYGRVNFF